MHYATLKKSKRLQKVYNYLLDYLPHSTYDIIKNTGVCAVNSAIAELRENCIPVGPARYQGKTADGNSIYTYQLEI